MAGSLQWRSIGPTRGSLHNSAEAPSGATASHPNDPPGERGHESNDDSKTSSSSSLSQVPLLMRLSEACTRHSSTHNKSQPSTDVLYEEDEELPDRCQRDIESLRKILPKVETAYLVPDSKHGKRRTNPRALDVFHLCQFYQSVLMGGFCPHAPVLFNRGKDGAEILPRVHQLYRHLTAKSIIQNTVSGAGKQRNDGVPSEQDPKGKNDSPTSVSTEICTTIAHLLNLIPERHLQQCLVRDLLTLIFDLACVAESGVLSVPTPQDTHDDADNAPTVELVMFDETSSQTNYSENAVEYTLHLFDMNELLSLQEGTLTILQILLSLQKTKRLEDIEAVASHSTVFPSASVDSYFFDCLDDSDSMSTFVASIRHVLLSMLQRWSRIADPKHDAISRTLTIRNKTAASRLLHMLLHDWELNGAASSSVMTEVSLVVSRAVLVYFRSVSNDWCSNDKDDSIYASLLSQLVCDVILFPEVGPPTGSQENVWNIRGQALIPLLDCLPSMTRTYSRHAGNTIQDRSSDENGSFLGWSSERMALRILVLRAIHASLYTETPWSPTSVSKYGTLRRLASSHCTSHGIYPHLFSLLKEVPLSSIVIGIVSALLQPSDGISDAGTLDFVSVCRVAWSVRTHQQQMREQDGDTSALSSGMSDTVGVEQVDTSRSPTLSGAKRRHSSVSNSPKRNRNRHPQQLRIERSPKRRRSPRGSSVGQHVHLADAIATPSPLSGADPALGPSMRPNDNTDSATPFLGDRSLDATFGKALNDALTSADRIRTNPGDYATSSRRHDESERDPSNGMVRDVAVMEDVISVTSMSRLVLETLYRSIRTTETGQSSRCEETHADVFGILCYLFQALKDLSTSFASNFSISNGDNIQGSLSALQMLDLITRVGLHAHFSIDSLLQQSVNSAPLREIRVALDMFSSAALSAWPLVGNKNTQIGGAKSIEMLGEADTTNGAAQDQHIESDKDNEETRRFCCGLCTELFAAFAVRCRRTHRAPELQGWMDGSISSTGIYTTPCLCGFLSESCDGQYRRKAFMDRTKEGTRAAHRDFENDCALCLFDLLPIQPRCALLACLHPFNGETANGMRKESTSGTSRTLESICMMLDPSFRASSADVITSALPCLPILFSLMALHSAESDNSPSLVNRKAVPEGTDDQETTHVIESDDERVSSIVSRLAVLLSKFQFQKYILPHAAASLTSSNRPAVVRASFVTIRRFQAFFELIVSCGSPEKKCSSPVSVPMLTQVRRDAHGLLAYLATSPDSDAAPCMISKSPDRAIEASISCVEDTYRYVRINLLSIQSDERDVSLPADVRLEKWKCIAWTCLHSTRSELRQTRVHQAVLGLGKEPDSQIGTRDINATNPQQLKRVPSLLWLIQASFADEASLVRDYAAREMGLMLLGNSSRLLYALFSTDEEWETLCQSALLPAKKGRQRQTDSTIVSRLFRQVDHLLYQHCYVPQSQLSFTMGYKITGEAPTVTSHSSRFPPQQDPSVALSFQRSAVFALSSLCQHADLATPCGVLVFEHALLRLVRFWTAMGDLNEPLVDTMTARRASISELCFGEICRINLHRPLGAIIMSECKETFIPALFSEVLIPNVNAVSAADEEAPDTIPPERRERHYQRLLLFIQSFLIPHELPTRGIMLQRSDHSRTSFGHSSMVEAMEFVDDALPSVLAAFVIEQDYDALRLTTGFRRFLIGEKRTIDEFERKAESFGREEQDEAEPLVGVLSMKSTSSIQSKSARVKQNTKELDEKTKLLCLSPNHIEHILSQLLLQPDRAPLVFFLRTVVKNKMTLQQLIAPLNQKVLKALVWELGVVDSPDEDLTSARPSTRNDYYVVQAIRKGALLIDQESPIVSEDANAETAVLRNLKISRNSLDGVDAVESDARKTAGSDAASRWVSSNFMYLLVNVVQSKWKVRTAAERITALRCLTAVLKYLRPLDAPQYVPQIMATVNMAMSDETLCLRLLAVQALSRFVRIVIEHNYKTIGLNLTTIVVSLFPVLSHQQEFEHRCEEFRYVEEATKIAVELLEWLTEGQLGKHLAPYFNEIPFLPPSSELDNVRAALKTNGVNLDNLLVLTATQNTQQGLSSRQSLTSEGASSNGENGAPSHPSYSSHMQAALHKRLCMVCVLLSHENVSLRRVVLNHLTDLLRANRGLLHAVIENQDGSSAEHFVTVDFSHSAPDGLLNCNDTVLRDQGADFGVACVTALMQTLLTRCVLEDDAAARVLLATCLGEVGAIDSHRIGEINMSAAVSSDDTGSWRLSQPPWQSRAARYELQLVTKLLVIALKAAPTSVDQHKIAFTIQQLLVLLDAFAKHSGSAECAVPSGVRTSGSSPYAVGGSREKAASGADRGEMNVWLVENLKKAGVLETIEPFWSTFFAESESVATRKPPFFQGVTSYFSWLSRFCSFLVKRSKENERSRWRDLFYACRTAVRSMAGINVAEFIFPLLILDSICFGSDESVVIKEMQDVLTFTDLNGWEDHASLSSGTEGSAIHGMNPGDRQKAVNAAFMVIDTLQYWAERETEDRHRSSRTRSAAAASRAMKTADAMSPEITASDYWPSDESIVRIEDFLQAIPLSLRASAAAAVGMHARALRCLEMAARLHVVERVFDGTHDRSEDDSSGKLEQRQELQKLIGGHLIEGIDIGLLKQVLGRLGDCETMKAVGQESVRIDLAPSVKDSIREREAYGDWEGAIQNYERALQLDEAKCHRHLLESGVLRCLLELGQFESVLNQVNGIVYRQPRCYTSVCGPDDNVFQTSLTSKHAIPFAVEAAWRLGRWSILEELVDDENVERRSLEAEALYQVSVGRAMLGLHKKSSTLVLSAVEDARRAVMTTISSFARESYSRSYSHLLRLHCLREIENASDLLCCSNATMQQDVPEFSAITEIAHSHTHDGWEWDGRLDVVSSLGSATIIDVRLALARLAGDSALEGSLFLTTGKQARKSGLYHIAENSLAQAEAAFIRLRSHDCALVPFAYNGFLSSVQMQLAKLKHGAGESSAALRILGREDVRELVDNKDDVSLRAHVVRTELRKFQLLGAAPGGDQSNDINRFSRRLLQSTQWMVEGALMGGAEVMDRFRVVQRLSPKLEKAHFYFAKYLDSLLESRMSALASQPALGIDDDTLRARVFFGDRSCQRYLYMAIEQYGEALKLDQKHVYQALPRLLSLWFDFTSINSDDMGSPRMVVTQGSTSSKQKRGAGAAVVDPRERFALSQDNVNQLILNLYKAIPAQSFYTAMAQLISRIGHRDKDTAKIVQSILKRVLTKFPAQAMWTLAWLRNSANPERSKIGEDIFRGAQRSLQKNEDTKMHDLLVASKSLFKFLIELAKFQPKEAHSRSFVVRPWKGDVELMEFIPPVQAALAVSPSSLRTTSTRDVFPALVPRMRSFCSQIQVMSSKARPKKLKAFAIPARQLRSRRSSSGGNNSASRPQQDDVGEIHFLVKQEAKGDLRKDARVQDLNNVINRLMASSGGSSGARASQQRRRLHLRTFSVVCLSEDCGILEWVPNTESMRSLVANSYNPQAAPFSVRRRGRRLSNFSDLTLKRSFEKCQAMYRTNGNLIRATEMFEELCLKQYPPLLYWWFVQNFLDPHAWYEARTRFTMSAAVWSAVGHVIGLGDRHSENILVDTSTGDCVHVDFDCIFDKGLSLPAPEVVPFRLTPNMLDAFGPTGADGVYSGSLKTAMSTLRENRETLLSVLEPFLKDPVIDWKRFRSQQKEGKKSSRGSMEAKRSVKVIDGRLKGIYNLRNPNAKRVRRTDGGSVDQDDEMTHLLPLSVEGQVHKMIREATSHENLVQLYAGWMPWL